MTNREVLEQYAIVLNGASEGLHALDVAVQATGGAVGYLFSEAELEMITNVGREAQSVSEQYAHLAEHTLNKCKDMP